MNLYTWSSAETPRKTDSALKTLQHRYPCLIPDSANFSGGSDDRIFRLKFRPADDPDTCSVRQEGDVFIISGNKDNMILRMIGSLMSGIIPEKAESCPFRMFGVMIDCSRNAVMTVEYMKTYLERLAVLGYNMVMLYTENTYKIEGEPFFGLMRGAYSQEELRQMDSYAASLGIEMIPCIQTLGHLEQIFRWGVYDDIRECGGILLPDEEKTYALIEKMIAACASAFQSRRIHIGMDEAHGVGTGKYRKLHGQVSPFEILNKHLKRVISICEKYGFKPMMWSDMFFRLGSKTGNYYDPDAVIPESVIETMPENVEMVYWDYYHTDKALYDAMLKHHREMKHEVIMGSGVWTWEKLWYDHVYTAETVSPCVESCREAGIRDIFFTLWGDDGAACDYDSAFAGLAFSADKSFTGHADGDLLQKRLDALFDHADYKAVTALGNVCYMEIPRIIWDDPVMLLYLGYFKHHELSSYYREWTFDKMRDKLIASLDVLRKSEKKGCSGDMILAEALAEAVLVKMNFAEAVIQTWQSGRRRENAEALLETARDYAAKIKKYSALEIAMWKRHNKPMGMETIQIRLSAACVRADELVERLQLFISGNAETIPEWDDLMQVMKQSDMQWGTWSSLSHGTTVI